MAKRPAAPAPAAAKVDEKKAETQPAAPAPAAKPPPVPDRSAERAAENEKADKELAAELAKGFYWRVSLPGQPSAAVEKEDEQAAIALYNRWAGINGTDHEYATEKVPAKGPRIYEFKEEGAPKTTILYGTSGKPGKANVALPTAVAPNLPKETKPEK